jgi:hypothetical protein
MADPLMLLVQRTLATASELALATDEQQDITQAV